MKNKLTDLNDHLFASLERLGDEDVTGDELLQEIDRSKAISSIAKDIVGNAKLALDVEIFKVDNNYHVTKNKMPEMLEAKDAL